MPQLDAYKLLQNRDLESIIMLLKKLKDNPELLDTAQRQAGTFMLNEIGTNNLTKQFCILGPKWGLSFYIASVLRLASNVKDATHCSKYLADVIAEVSEYTKSPLPLITKNQIEAMLELVEAIGAAKIIAFNPYGHPFRVVQIPFKREYNSVYDATLNLVLCSRVDKETGKDPQYVFLHEVGHALQFGITKDIHKVPISFKPVFELVYGNKFDNVVPVNMVEVFADSFSIAAVYGTQYCSITPFHTMFFTIHQAMLAVYFRMLCADPGHSNSEDFWTEKRKAAFNDVIKKEEAAIKEKQSTKK